MSTLDVVSEVLREVAPRALCAKQVVELARGRLPTASKTPETVVSRDLAIDLKRHGTKSRFLRVERGEFVLKEALPTAFYNDNDAYAAAWTRNLIAAGEIAEGVVDERSIRDLKPSDVASYRQFHAFSGIGVWSRALRDAGWPDDVNVWSGSCPCQPLSQAGRRRGFADERHLWPEWFRLIAACRPAVVIGEQVSSKDGLAWLDLVFADLEGADYSVRAIDIPAACAGAPHARQRLYYVAYARERGREILGTSWLHDRGQSGDDVARRRSLDGGNARALSDAAGTRPCMSEDAGANRADAGAGAEAIQWRPAGDLESQRDRDADDSGAVPDTECVMRDAGWIGGSHGRAEIEPDRYGEADGALFGGAAGAIFGGAAGGARIGADDGALRMGDTGLSRGGRDAGEVSRAQEAGEGERLKTRDLSDESVASSTDDGGRIDSREDGLVRGAAGVAGDSVGSGGAFVFKPGDRIRIGDDPGWGGAVRGYWAQGVEWIYCRPEPGHEDGRWRPAESGTQPLVDGLAPGMGRTRAKRLRGFGNAIVLPLATTFVEAVIDTLVDAARTPDVETVPVEGESASALGIETTAVEEKSTSALDVEPLEEHAA